MKKARQIALSYGSLRKAIAGELMAGAERVRRAYREELVRTTWNIGKILNRAAGPEDGPNTGYTALIARLALDLERDVGFFYDAAKFHRLYPGKVPLELSISHYLLLIRVKDPRRRLALEKKAIKEGINGKDFRMYTKLPYELTHPKPGFERETWFQNGGKKAVLAVDRGRLYHYQTTTAPRNGRVLVDLGFGIERDVRTHAGKTSSAGLILCTMKKHPGNPDGESYNTKISLFDKKRLYTYAATLVRVIDGDTIIARVDLGFRTHKTETFRLRGIDAPEITCALGQKAKAEVEARLKPCACLAIKTYKQEKFGRFLADVFYKKEVGEDRERVLNEGAFLNQELLDEGLAVPYDGEAKDDEPDVECRM